MVRKIRKRLVIGRIMGGKWNIEHLCKSLIQYTKLRKRHFEQWQIECVI